MTYFGSDALGKQLARSSRREVRNPILALPAARALREFDATTKEALRLILRQLADDAAARAQKCWRTHKAPMAVYWKAVSVYARHIARAIA